MRPHVIILVLALLALLVTSVACGPKTLEATPYPLLGRWETDAAKYEDRWFEIRNQSLIWGIGTLKAYEHPITRIEFEEDEGVLVYDFHYWNQEQGYDDSLRVRLSPGTDPRIQLGARAEEWYAVR
ncbi:MAG: hypothetical protein QNK05_11825 [Myxococcota bacterium]|nr:hypothetical protein [Myxococcota bacterium]